MAALSEHVQSLFIDIQVQGGVYIPLKRLRAILGWGQDRPGMWRDLLTAWAKLGTGHDLTIVPVWSNVFITMARNPQPVLVAALADPQSAAPPAANEAETAPAPEAA
jgi:hypothetical protein